MYFWHLLALKFGEPDVRRLKRRISRRQFLAWVKFHGIHPIDGDKRRDHLLAVIATRVSRAVGDNPPIEYEALIADPFEATPDDDMATIVQAFQASG